MKDHARQLREFGRSWFKLRLADDASAMEVQTQILLARMAFRKRRRTSKKQ